MLVAARMLWTRFLGGSTSSSDSSQSMPSRASASMGPHKGQVRPCASKSLWTSAVSKPSKASASKASNWLHWSPSWRVWLFICFLPVAQGKGIVLLAQPGINRVSNAVLPAAPEVVHQQVAGKRGQPGSKSAFLNVIAAKGPVDSDKDILGQVLGVVSGVGEAVAEVIDAPLVQTHNALPSHSIAGHTLPHQ